MYRWLVENLKEYYTFVKVLKKKDCGEVLLYKHNQVGNYVVGNMLMIRTLFIRKKTKK